MLKCGSCGGNYIVVDSYRYGCSKHINQGNAVCSNGIKVPRKFLERRILKVIKQDLFTDHGIELFAEEVSRLLAESSSDQRKRLANIQADLKRTEVEIENIMTAIKAGIVTDTTKAKLEKAETTKDRMRKVLETSPETSENIKVILPRAIEIHSGLIDNFEEVSLKQIGRARKQIQALVGGEIILHPTSQGHLEAELFGDYAGLLSLAKGKTRKSKLSLVAGVGFSQDPTNPTITKSV